MQVQNEVLTIYTTNSCASCRKAKKWLDDMEIPYKEKNLFQYPVTREDIKLMLKNADNGFEDIISKRSKVLKEKNIDIDDMKFGELVDFIIDNPSVLKRPIIVGSDRMQVGYSDEDIRIFVPRYIREIRRQFGCENGDSNCEYKMLLEKGLIDLRKARVNK